MFHKMKDPMVPGTFYILHIHLKHILGISLSDYSEIFWNQEAFAVWTVSKN